VFRRWLIALTLIGIVLTGVAMTTHASTDAHPVDALVASARSLTEFSQATSHSHSLVGDARSSDTAAASCPDCGGESTAGDHAMLMALGCVFVAMLTSLLVVLARPGVSFRMLRPRVGIGRVVSTLDLAFRPPDLLALGISRT